MVITYIYNAVTNTKEKIINYNYYYFFTVIGIYINSSIGYLINKKKKLRLSLLQVFIMGFAIITSNYQSS